MRALSLTLAVALLLALPSMAVADGPDSVRLEELWKTGSLWQVGDNIPKVEAARKEIVAAGDAGLAFIFTKLDTTDGLQFRCLEAVFKGFGAKALPGLFERMAHADVKVRRNVAAMLGVIDDKSAAAKMVEHLKKESDLRCKVGHLQTLARWKEPTALDPLIECTRITQEQEPLAERLKVRIVPLLGNYDDETAVARLMELLDDPAYFVRDAARDALRSKAATIEHCYARLTSRAGVRLGPAGTVTRSVLLIQVCAWRINLETAAVFREVMLDEWPAIRAHGAIALAQWLERMAAALPAQSADLKVLRNKFIPAAKGWLEDVLLNESDPAVLQAIETSRESIRTLQEAMR